MSRFYNALYRFCLVAVLILPAHGRAQEGADDPAVRIEKYIQHFTVQPDGSYVQIIEEQRLIMQSRGIKSSAQLYFQFNASLETIDVLDAYTQKPDGRRVQVKKDQIRMQQEPRSFNAPMFQDIQFKAIIFPEVAVQDRVYVKLQRKQHTPLFPGYFQNFTLRGPFPFKEFRVIYDLPAAMKLQGDSAGFRRLEPVTTGDRTQYEWVHIPSKRPRPETGSVSYADYGDRLFVSTFPGYAAFAKAYESGAADKTVPTAKVKALAEKLTAGIADPQEKAKALHEWIRKNIRYVAVYVGPGGVVPHAADTVLDNFYGDCKDHVTLLEAMLTAVGIESTPALINSGNAYRLPAAPALGTINHVITYIPSLDLYLDPTAAQTEFGYLPEAELGKPVVLTKKGKLATTPYRQAGKITTNIKIRIDADGSATFTETEITQGSKAEPSRQFIENIAPNDRAAFVRRLLQRLNLQGNGKLEMGNPSERPDEYRLSMNGRIESLVILPGPSAAPALTSFGAGIWSIVRNLDRENERRLPFVCLNTELAEESVFEFPESMTITKIPTGIELDSKYFYYRSAYALNGNLVSVSRAYRTKLSSPICTQQDFEEMKEANRAMRADLNGQILIGAR